MEFGVIEIFTATGLAILSLYYYLTSNFEYWKKRNVKGPKPIPIFGNFKDTVLGRKHDARLIKEFYDEFKRERLIGVYADRNPSLIVKDLDLIKDVLIKDFNVFTDRGMKLHEKVEPFCLNIFNLEHERWKPLRTKLSPIFTSGKLREMFYLITDCAEHFQKYAELLANKNDSVDCRDLTGKFTTDVIGACVFGLNMNAINDEDSEFRKFGKSIVETNFKSRIRRFVRQFIPKLYNLIGGFIQPSSNAFFEKCLRDTIEYRKKTNGKRNDFIDLLIDLKNNSEKMQDFELTDRLLLSQAFIFFAAGFETSSSTMSNTLYELALHQDIQNKLRKEINEQLTKCGGKLTYDCIKSMRYLDQIFKETLRKYPAATALIRKSVHSYTFDDTKVTIPEGSSILIPVWAIHRDPEIYPNPDDYDPERFSEENDRSRHPMAYLPFGDGPHNCIGARFANYQTKVGIIAIIEKMKVEPCEKTCKEYRLLPGSFIPVSIGGVHVKLTKI